MGDENVDKGGRYMADEVFEGEEHIPLTVAEFKRARTAERGNLNRIIFDFQKQVIAAQAVAEESRQVVRRVYNTVQTVVRALYNKGLVNNTTIEHAGRQLWKEAQENMAKAARAAGEAMKVMPLDEVQKLIDKTRPAGMGGEPPKEPQRN